MDERPGRGGQYAEDERARAENDQDRDRSDDIFRRDKSENGDQERCGNQPARPAVRDPLRRRLVLFRIFHHADQFLKGAVFPDLHRFDVDGSEAVDRPAENRLADRFVDRQALAGHDGLIDRGLAGDDHAVDRDLRTELTHILYHLRDSERYIKRILSCESGDMFMKFFKEYLRRVFRRELEKVRTAVPEDYLLNHTVCDFAETVRWWMDHDGYSPEDICGLFLSTTPFES